MVVATRTARLAVRDCLLALPSGSGSLGRCHGRGRPSGLAWRHRPRGLVWRRRSALAGNRRREVLLHGLVPAIELELLHGPVREREADHLERRGFDRNLVDLGDDPPLVLHVHGLVRAAHLDDLHLGSLVEARLEAHLGEGPGVRVRHEVDGLLHAGGGVRELVEEVLRVACEECRIRAAPRGEVRLRCRHVGGVLRSGRAELVALRLTSEEHLVHAARAGWSRGRRRVVVGTRVGRAGDHLDDREEQQQQRSSADDAEEEPLLGRVGSAHRAPPCGRCRECDS